MTTPSYQQQVRAEQLAALTGLDQVALPGQFRHAVTVYRQAMAIPAPVLPEPGAAGRAATTAALALVRRALNARQPGTLPPLDTAPIAAARQGEQDALDQAALVEQVQAAAAALLAEAARDQLDLIITAIQDRHARVMGDLAGQARRLPPGIDDLAALQAGGSVRADYLACGELASQTRQLREALAVIDDRPASLPDALELTLSYEQSGKLHQRHWQARAEVTTFGPLDGSLRFWLAACRDPDLEWWLPTQTQVQRRAREVRQEQQARAVAKAQAGGYVLR